MIEFTRASKATYIDKNGVLREAQINEPRFEKDGLLVEGSSTNKVTDDMYLTLHSSITGEELGIPSGLLKKAYRCFKTENVNAHAHLKTVQIVFQSSPITVTLSIYALESSVGKYDLNAYSHYFIADGSFIQTESPLHKIEGTEVGGFARYSTTMTLNPPTYGDSINVNIRVGEYGKPFNIVYTQYQVEEMPFATSYIPTNGAPVTRAAESLYLDNFSDLYLTDTGTVHIVAKAIGASNDYPRVFDIRDTNSQWSLSYPRKVGDENTQFTGATPAQFNGGSHEIGVPHKFVVSNNGEIATGYVDGVLAGSYKDYKPLSKSKKLYFGAVQGASEYFGHLSDFMVWNNHLSENQIKEI